MPESQSIYLNPEIRRIIDAARGVWTRRLIDYSRANSLLFYRDLKVGTLDLSAEMDAVESLIAGNALKVEALFLKDRYADISDPAKRKQKNGVNPLKIGNIILSASHS